MDFTLLNMDARAICNNQDGILDIMKAFNRSEKRRKISNLLNPITGSYFVTINPHENIQPKKFFSKIEKISEWKWVDKYYYVFEQRSTIEGEYKGIHAHMYVSGSINKARLLSTLYTSLKTYVGNQKHVDVKVLKTEKDVSNVIEYMNGSKSPEKLPKVANDEKFRSEYDLKPFYTNMDI